MPQTMTLARLLLLIAVCIWGWTFVATKVCLAYLEPVELLGWRLVLALPALLAIAWFQRVRLDLGGRVRSIALGATLITVHFLVQITGLQFTTATNTGWIIAVSPLVMAVLAVLLLGERVSRKMAFGVAISTLGIVVLVSKGELAGLGWLGSLGDWLILVSAHTWALYTIAIRDLARNRPPIAVTIQVFLPATIVVVVIVAATSEWSRLVRLPPRRGSRCCFWQSPAWPWRSGSGKWVSPDWEPRGPGCSSTSNPWRRPPSRCRIWERRSVCTRCSVAVSCCSASGGPSAAAACEELVDGVAVYADPLDRSSMGSEVLR
jgi:drug/metabolite transporter (DMT)-like permease